MKVSRRGCYVPVAFALLLALCSIPALAQSSSSGTVSGQTVDQQGAAIPGVEIQLTDPSTNITLKTKSNDSGRFIVVNVNPGVYNVTMTKTGFSTRKVFKQDVSVGQTLNMNATLEVGSVTNVVEVTTSPGAELQTVNATIGTTVSGAALLYLPTLGNDVSGLAIYQPGVSPEGSVAGAMYDQNTFQLDGGQNSNDMDGSMNTYTRSYSANGSPTGVMPTPVDSIEEFKVSTAGQTADFNGSSGGQIQMVTRRGTNGLHGSLYEYYFATNIGAANSWDANHTPSGNLGYTPLPISHNNRYGFSLGGPMLPRLLGGKTYFFFNYEGFNNPNKAVINKSVPTELLRAGVIQINQGGTYVPYNINPFPVTVGGTTYQPATCGGGVCDPRGIGLNQQVSQIWNKFMPLPNNLNLGDGHNVEGFQGIAALPQTSKLAVARIDHDFGEKWRFMASYRYYSFINTTTNQLDIGGVLGGKFGIPNAVAPRPQKPDFLVGGLSTTVSPTITNDFHFSYLRNFWQWGSQDAPPQLPGLGGALEIGGETAQALIPYNVNTQNVRQRFWDGHDTMFRDDVTKIKGAHIIQFGGNFTRNYDYHLRTDNGQGIFNKPVYQINNGPGIAFDASTRPGAIPSSQISNWNKYYSEILGLVSQPQTLFTRTGPSLTLNPPGTPMFDQSTINFYNLYATDSWHIKPSLTITYGLGYQVETPPVEKNGKQVELVDASGKPIVYQNYFDSKKAAALQGQVYNPILGFATIANVTGASHKYPFNPFYGGLSPRAAVAWNPKFTGGILGTVLGDGKTVIRGGYGQIYSRLNGVGLVLIPLLGTGLGQAVSCIGASKSGQCLGSGGVTPTSAFRIGTDGLTAPIPTPSQTLAQPYFPGVNGNIAAGSGSVLDPSFQPAKTYNYNFSIQREIRPRLLAEVGYIGRIIHNEWQQTNIDAVPYMTTLNGQSFAQAYAQVYQTVAAGSSNPATQPFFEAALGGATSAFCKGFASCTAAVVKNGAMNDFITNTQVYQLWSALGKAPSWTLGRTLPSSQGPGVPAGQLAGVFADNSSGFGNYNAFYTTMTMKDFKGITSQANFTYGRALGTGNQSQATSGYTVTDPFNVRSMYGPQFFDYKFIYTQTFLYQPPFFKDQRGAMGRLLGGWKFAPLFTARSGAPNPVQNSNGGCESFGEGSCAAGSTNDQAVLASKYTGNGQVLYNQNVANSATGAGVNSNAINGGNGLNQFANPNLIIGQFRNCILGLDTSCSPEGPIRGLGFWNLDMNIAKDVRMFSIRDNPVSATLSFQFVNVLNHTQMRDPYLDISDPANFGVLGSNNPNGTGQANTPRNLTFSLRIHF